MVTDEQLARLIDAAKQGKTVQAQWTREDAVLWATGGPLTWAKRQVAPLKPDWSLWQKLLWVLVILTPFRVRVIMSRDGRRPYLLRATLWPRLARWLPPVFLHYGFRADEESDLHNHPWTAVSLILSEGYVEQRWSDFEGRRVVIERFPGNVVVLRRNTYHRILSGHWFSLFVPFRRTSLPEAVSWCFWRPETGQQWGWKAYTEAKRKERDER